MMMYDSYVYDMIVCARVTYAFYYLLFISLGQTLGHANTRLQGISLKVPEHDGQLSQVHLTIFVCSCVVSVE